MDLLSILLLNLRSLCVEHNYFICDNAMYPEVEGTAMRSDLAPSYVCLSMGFLEVTKLLDTMKQVLNKDDYRRLTQHLNVIWMVGLSPYQIQFFQIYS